MTHILKFVNNPPPYVDWEPTANQSGEGIKMRYTNMYSNIKVYQKYVMTSIKVGQVRMMIYYTNMDSALLY